jgi:hypothetical protein
MAAILRKMFNWLARNNGMSVVATKPATLLMPNL